MLNLFGRRSSLAGSIPKACIGCKSMLGLISVRLCEGEYVWRDTFCEGCLKEFRDAFAGAITSGALLIDTEMHWTSRPFLN
jgi:hypothetical protein